LLLRSATIVVALAEVKTMAERVQVQVRMPKSLQLKLKAKWVRHKRELGAASWSFNDELVALLEAALKGANS
jgi:hypothetical protein